MLLQQYKIVFGGTMGAGKSEAIKMLSDIPVMQTETINTDLDAHSKLMCAEKTGGFNLVN